MLVEGPPGLSVLKIRIYICGLQPNLPCVMFYRMIPDGDIDRRSLTLITSRFQELQFKHMVRAPIRWFYSGQIYGSLFAVIIVAWL